MRIHLLIAVVLVACGCQSASTPTSNKQEKPVRKLSVRHLPNAVQVHPKVISGGLPEDEEAFAELQSLGVKTIISVDGMKPDVETAKKYGLRYVHLPHGYDGIPTDRAQELAKAVKELDGPIYIHCHHGKHRSPAAAAVACVGAGLIGKATGKEVLAIAGTAEHYRGLFAAAESAKSIDNEVLKGLPAEFPSVAKLPAMAEAMVAIEHMFDHLKSLEKSGWQRLDSHPDLDPAHEALILREHFTELLRTDEVAEKPESFQRLLRDGEAAAKQLEQDLQVNASAAKVSKSFAAVAENCTQCHRSYRDVPQEAR